MRVLILGAGHEVGRSSILVEVEGKKILLDAGITPRNGGEGKVPVFSKLGIDPADLDAVVITHAHLDHVGYVPYLIARGYEGPIIASAPTVDQAELLIRDSMKQMPPEIKITEHHVDRFVQQVETVNENDEKSVAGITLRFLGAGHILGSLMVRLDSDEGSIIYTGDLKAENTKLFRGAEGNIDRHPDFVEGVDHLIIESTYADTLRLPDEYHERYLMRRVKKVTERGGKVLIPAFAIHRAQYVALLFAAYGRELLDFTYMDGLAVPMSQITAYHREWLRTTFPRRLLKVAKEHREEIDELLETPGAPLVIIASSGMLNGGASLEYFKQIAPIPGSLIMFTGYQVRGTLGRKVLDGEKRFEFDGQRVPVRAEVDIAHLSAHSDNKKLVTIVKKVRPRDKVILVHGEKPEYLLYALRDEFRGRVLIPETGKEALIASTVIAH